MINTCLSAPVCSRGRLHGPSSLPALAAWLEPWKRQLKNESVGKIIWQLEELRDELEECKTAWETVAKEAACLREHRPRMDFWMAQGPLEPALPPHPPRQPVQKLKCDVEAKKLKFVIDHRPATAKVIIMLKVLCQSELEQRGQGCLWRACRLSNTGAPMAVLMPTAVHATSESRFCFAITKRIKLVNSNDRFQL